MGLVSRGVRYAQFRLPAPTPACRCERPGVRNASWGRCGASEAYTSAVRYHRIGRDSEQSRPEQGEHQQPYAVVGSDLIAILKIFVGDSAIENSDFFPHSSKIHWHFWDVSSARLCLVCERRYREQAAIPNTTGPTDGPSRSSRLLPFRVPLSVTMRGMLTIRSAVRYRQCYDTLPVQEKARHSI